MLEQRIAESQEAQLNKAESRQDVVWIGEFRFKDMPITLPGEKIDFPMEGINAVILETSKARGYDANGTWMPVSGYEKVAFGRDGQRYFCRGWSNNPAYFPNEEQE